MDLLLEALTHCPLEGYFSSQQSIDDGAPWNHLLSGDFLGMILFSADSMHLTLIYKHSLYLLTYACLCLHLN
jgi:hypothetical protein